MSRIRLPAGEKICWGGSGSRGDVHSRNSKVVHSTFKVQAGRTSQVGWRSSIFCRIELLRALWYAPPSLQMPTMACSYFGTVSQPSLYGKVSQNGPKKCWNRITKRIVAGLLAMEFRDQNWRNSAGRNRSRAREAA